VNISLLKDLISIEGRDEEGGFDEELLYQLPW
jgi:hypothetical protein